MVQHKQSNKYVKMGEREAGFLQHLMTSGAENIDAYQGDLNEQERDYLLAKFEEWGFFSEAEPDANDRTSSRRWTFNWRSNDLTTIKFLSVNPDDWLNKGLPVIRALLHPAAIAFYILLILTAGYVAGKDVTFAETLLQQSLGIREFAIIYVMIVLTTIVHELSHGIVCKYYGGKVTQLGAMLFYFSPAMFCDVSDTYLFRKKRQKLAVLFAGIFSQWLMTSLATLAYYGLQAAGIHVPILLYYAVANLGMSLLNLMPLVKLDGYWMLSHGLGIVNLRTKAFRALFQLIKSPWQRSSSAASAFAEGKLDKFVIFTYGLAATLFTPLFWSWGLYNIQKRLYSVLGTSSYVVTAGIAIILIYHLIKFIRSMNQSIIPTLAKGSDS